MSPSTSPALSPAPSPSPSLSLSPTPSLTSVDVHQHLWPPALIDALRARRAAPRLEGWTLLLDGERPYEVRPADHDAALRRAPDPRTHRAIVGLSSPLGIEALAPEQAGPLLTAWHEGARALGPGFEAWASVGALEPDLDDLWRRLAEGFVGLQIPATRIGTPAALAAAAPILEVCQRAGRPVFVHPGPVERSARAGEGLPDWWPAVVDYTAQLQAAWWSWIHVGRSLLPELRIGFAAGAGLAPAHQERFRARSGRSLVIDPHTFVDSSSYSRQGLDSLIRVLGIDAIVLGSDAPYGTPTDPGLGAAATHAIRVLNPLRLLKGHTP